jgi:hypothetical protein
MSAPQPSSSPPSSPPSPGHAYAGLGSRETPDDMLAVMEALGGRLAGRRWLLRTGLSPGADQAFYRGALLSGGDVELYLPWPGFQAEARLDSEGANVRELARPSAAACELAGRFHEGWDALEPPDRRLLARDAHEVLGGDLISPAQLLVCWTADGSIDGEDLYDDGTGQALRIASEHGVRVLNLARPDDVEELARL